MVQPARRVQDDSREAALARMLNLVTSTRRIGADAQDEHGNPFELKTTTTNSLGTGRDIGFTYLRDMRKRYWVAARGSQTAYGFSFQAVYFLHPDDLSGWITAIETRLTADAALIEVAAEAMAAKGRPEVEILRLRYLGSRGLTLNNPKIPWGFVEAHGTLLGDHPELDLRVMVAARPMLAPKAAEAVPDPTFEVPSPFADQ